jgi:hypothetical protein
MRIGAVSVVTRVGPGRSRRSPRILAVRWALVLEVGQAALVREDPTHAMNRMQIIAVSSSKISYLIAERSSRQKSRLLSEPLLCRCDLIFKRMKAWNGIAACDAMPEAAHLSLSSPMGYHGAVMEKT